MISVHQLAEMISTSAKGTSLRQTSRQPGRERFTGLCPFHSEKTPSFDVFVGADGAGHYYCHGCHTGGSAAWWLHKVEGTAGGLMPDPEISRRRQERKQREERRQLLLDVNPDLPPEAEEFVDAGDSFSVLQLRVRAKLARARR